MTRSLPSREALAEHRRRQFEDGYEFPLDATSLGMDQPIVARVRALDLFDRAAINALPNDVQAAVWDAIKTSQREQETLQSIKGEAANIVDFGERGKHILEIADRFVIACFLEPRVVAAESDLAKYPDAWVVTDIASSDRFAFLQLNNDPASGASRNLKLFRPDPAGDVAHDAPGEAAAQPAPDLGELRGDIHAG